MLIVKKPLWGWEEVIVNNELYCCKKLYIEEGKHFSLQYHKKKHETFYIDRGKVLLEKGIDGKALDQNDFITTSEVLPGDTISIPPYTKHRCTSLYGRATIIEVSTRHENSDTYKVENRVVMASGYFDPLHVGHVEYLQKARSLGDKLVVILNNDKQAQLKKGYVFMPQEERAVVVASLACVDEVTISIDEDPTVCKTIALIKGNIFAKGGDRYSYEIPESKICNELGIDIVDGLGEKIQSSSELIAKQRSYNGN